MIEACGMCGLKEEASKIFQDIKKDSIEPSVDTFNAYFQACGKAVHNVGRRCEAPVQTVTTVEEDKEAAMAHLREKKQGDKLLKVLQKTLIELSNKCNNPDCDRYLREEEIMSAWPRSLDRYSIKCPACGKEFIPDMVIQLGPEKVKHFYFLSPPLFAKEVHNLVENKSAGAFFCSEFYKKHKVTFWNMIFYFRLINQPYFMLDLNYKNSMGDILKIVRRQPTIPNKQADTRIIIDPSKRQRTETRVFGGSAGTISLHMKFP